MTTRTTVVACLLSVGAALATVNAHAHLIPAKQATVNVVGSAVFAVVSVPASALRGADDDGDGTIDVTELERHENALRAEIDRRFAIFDGDAIATTARVDLLLSPGHDDPRDRAREIVALKHVTLPGAPRDLRVRSDLFGPASGEQGLTVTATRHPGGGTETETQTLTPSEPTRAFFPAGPSAGRHAVTTIATLPGTLPVAAGLGLAAVALAGVALVRLKRTAAHASRA